jgi:hypothetical protein
MNGRHRITVAFLNAAAFAFIAGGVRAQDVTNGQWKGVATRQGADLPIELTLQRTGQQLNGFITVPTMGLLNFPLKNVLQDGSNLQFDLATDTGSFTFKGNTRGDSLTGSWKLFGFDSQVSMIRTGIERLPYNSEEVTCRGRNVNLAGSLSIPKSPSVRHPAVVFVHGSGPSPRQAFNFWADQFTRMSVASLVFDKRGSGLSTGNWHDADFNDLAHDVLACVDVLKARSDIDGRRIGLFGQSQGGWVGPLAASLSPTIAWLVVVSGAAVTPARQGWWEVDSKLRKRGIQQEDIDRASSFWQLNDDVTRTGERFAELQAAVDSARDTSWFGALGFPRNTPAADAPVRRFLRRIIDFDPCRYFKSSMSHRFGFTVPKTKSCLPRKAWSY